VSGELVYGKGHPEMGHMRIRSNEMTASAGSCPFHGNCWEGTGLGPGAGEPISDATGRALWIQEHGSSRWSTWRLVLPI